MPIIPAFVRLKWEDCRVQGQFGLHSEYQDLALKPKNKQTNN